MFAKIQADRMAAMGNDKVKFNILGVVIADIQRNKTKNISDDDVIKVLNKVKDNLTESLEIVTEPEVVQKYKHEQEIVSSYLPVPFNDDELFAIIDILVKQDPAMLERKNIFPFLKKNYNGKYSGQQASSVYLRVVEANK